MKARLDNHRVETPARSCRPPKHPSLSSRVAAGSVAFKRILVPVDFTAGSGRALQHAASLALAHRARVLPLHVTAPICFTVDCGYGLVNRTVPDENSLRRTRTQLQRLVHRIVPRKLAEDGIVRSGEPIEQIMMAATEWKADLIVMLAHDAPGGDSAPPTHTVDRLVREVPCPVLVLHGGPSRNRPSEKRERIP